MLLNLLFVCTILHLALTSQDKLQIQSERTQSIMLINTTNSLNHSTTGNLSLPPFFCHQMTKQWKYILLITYSSTALLLAFLGNVFAVIIILVCRSLRNKPSNILITSLALSDIGVALFLMPLQIHLYAHDHRFCSTVEICTMHSFTDSLFSIASISHLFMIAIERFIAVSVPFIHQRLFTTRRTYFYACLTWFYSIVWACAGLLPWDHKDAGIIVEPKFNLCLNMNKLYYNTVLFAVYLVPLFIIGILYILAWQIAARHVYLIASLDPHKREGHKRSTQISVSEIKATKTLSITYGAFLGCWLPLGLITVISNFFPRTIEVFRLKNPRAFEIVLMVFIHTLPNLNSCLNPFIYILFNRHFRCCTRKIIYAIRRKTLRRTETMEN